ncbi:hypothetical protein P9H32_16400 [Pontiella sp. NLcol2]|uniref:Uncharacterized protein n=1 Tax=Pontiella agarivorans TaxID=3038953 RepID=A0ABU5N1C4_9BACT|nr:hypothetical protein [Pontiella agarivorans]
MGGNYKSGFFKGWKMPLLVRRNAFGGRFNVGPNEDSMNYHFFKNICVSRLMSQGSGIRKSVERVQNMFFPNLDLSPEVFFTYISALFLDTRISSPGRGVRQNVLLPVLVFRGASEGVPGLERTRNQFGTV